MFTPLTYILHSVVRHDSHAALEHLHNVWAEGREVVDSHSNQVLHGRQSFRGSMVGIIDRGVLSRTRTLVSHDEYTRS